MGVTKTALYSQEQNTDAKIAKAIGHPARVAILQYLIKTNSCITGSIVRELGLAQATISQHLKELKQLGLIQGTIQGSAVCYCINAEKWNEVRDVLGGFISSVCHHSECC